MSKKIIMACMAVAALAAFAMPSSAIGQEITVTHPTNTVAATPLKIIGTNTDIVSKLTDSSGNSLAECTFVKMTGTLEKNTHPEVSGTITTAEFKGTPGVTPHTAHCSSSFGTITVTTNPATNGLPWCLRSASTMAADEVQIRGNKCSEAARPIRFILHSSVAGECTYERTTAVVGKFTTHPTATSITVTAQEFPRVAGGIFCPTKGFLDLTMSLYAETEGENETPLWIDPIKT